MARIAGAWAGLATPEAALVGRAAAPARLFRPGEPLAIMPGAFVN